MEDSDGISFERLLREGSLISSVLAIIIFGSLYRNPEIWLQDYPPAIREKYGPKSPQAKRELVLFGIPFILVMFGGVIRSNLALRRKNHGILPFGLAFKNALGLLLFFWLYDLLVIDWFILMTLKPNCAILPGTEGMPEYEDHMYHLRAAIPALPGLVLISLILALLTAKRS